MRNRGVAPNINIMKYGMRNAPVNNVVATEFYDVYHYSAIQESLANAMVNTRLPISH